MILGDRATSRKETDHDRNTRKYNRSQLSRWKFVLQELLECSVKPAIITSGIKPSHRQYEEASLQHRGDWIQDHSPDSMEFAWCPLSVPRRSTPAIGQRCRVALSMLNPVRHQRTDDHSEERRCQPVQLGRDALPDHFAAFIVE